MLPRQPTQDVSHMYKPHMDKANLKLIFFRLTTFYCSHKLACWTTYLLLQPLQVQHTPCLCKNTQAHCVNTSMCCISFWTLIPAHISSFLKQLLQNLSGKIEEVSKLYCKRIQELHSMFSLHNVVRMIYEWGWDRWEM
jgi:hypothetical protein